MISAEILTELAELGLNGPQMSAVLKILARSGAKPECQRVVVISDFPENGFDIWYGVYPRKKGKDDARKAFEKVRRSGRVPWAELLIATRRFALSGTDPQFTAHPATWLNRGSWQDEPDQPQQRKSSGIAGAFDRLAAHITGRPSSEGYEADGMDASHSGGAMPRLVGSLL